MCQAPPPKPSTMEMSSVFGRKREEDEDAEEVGWRFSSLFGCKRIAHDGLLMRWKWLKGFNMLQPVEATLWCFSVSSNILEFLRFFSRKSSPFFLGWPGDHICFLQMVFRVVLRQLLWFLQSLQRSCWMKMICLLLKSQWKCAGRGRDGNAQKPKPFVQVCGFEILRKFDTDSLEICALIG